MPATPNNATPTPTSTLVDEQPNEQLIDHPTDPLDNQRHEQRDEQPHAAPHGFSDGHPDDHRDDRPYDQRPEQVRTRAPARMRKEDVLARVREEFARARRAGDRNPGRPTLLERIPGATDYQVRQALLTVASQSPPDRHHTDPPPEIRHDAGGAQSASVASAPAGLDPEPVTESPARQDAVASGHQAVRVPRPWPLAFIGAAAGVAVWGGWVDLGRLTGFGLVQPLPGLLDSFHLNTAIVLPLGIEAYGGYALRVWLSAAALSARTRRYACRSAWASLVVGAAAQVASHLMKAAHLTSAPWWVTVLVACVPVGVLGLATGLATLVRQDTTLATSAPPTIQHGSPAPPRPPTVSPKVSARRGWRFWWSSRRR